jgi:hypothetical protein
MSDERAPATLERELESIRGNLTGIVRELARRKDHLLHWRWQLVPGTLPSERTLATVAFATAGAVMAGAVAVRRHNHRPDVRARRLVDAVQRVSDDPRRLAPRRSSIGTALLALGLGAIAAFAAVRVAQRVLARGGSVKTPQVLSPKPTTPKSPAQPTDAWQALNPPGHHR